MKRLIEWIMKILYHPKTTRFDFEPYVAPEDFDRHIQPIDIYELFKSYYRKNHNARYSCRVMDSIPTNWFGSPDYLPLILDYWGWNTDGYSFHYGYTKDSIDYEFDLTPTKTTLTYYGTYDTITVNSTATFPESGVICNDSLRLYGSSGKFVYTSKDATHFYGSPQSFGTSPSKSISLAVDFSGTTKRWMIVNHSTIQPENLGAAIVVPGIDWAYMGKCKTINGTVGPSNSPQPSDLKYIHTHSLDCITTLLWCGYGGTLYGCPLSGTLHIPTNITEILYVAYPGDYTERGGYYAQCTGITKIIFTPNLQTIGKRSFYGCTGLDGTLTIPDTLTTIGIMAFYGCNKLDAIDLGTGVQSIGSSAFQSCTQLTGTLTFPTSLTAIGALAFYGCTAYTGTLTIASGITTIGQGAFGDDNFTDIDVTANAGYEDVDNVLYEISTRTALHSVKGNTGTITFQSNTLIIGDYCCLRNQRTGTLTVPDSVTRVGIYAFYDCDGFTALDLETTSSALEMIDDHAFRYCGNIAGTLTIPNSVTLIDQYAFESVPKITAIVIGNGVVTIGAGAFYNDVAVTSITFGTGLVTIGADAFRQMTAISENLVIPNSVETIGATAFYNNTARTGTLTLGTGLKTIGGSAFGQVPFTGTLAIPSLVTAIGEGAFHNNNFSAVASLALGFTVSDYVLYDETVSGQIKAHTSIRGYTGTLTLKAGTTSVLYLCFYNNDNRSGAIVIPYTVTEIGDQAFDDCGGFNSTATIGDGSNGSALTAIGQSAFRGCANIMGWNIYRTPAPTCNNSFSGYAKPLHIKVGSTGYDVTPATAAAPWTNTAIFSSVTADL